MKTTALVIGLAIPLWAGFAEETLRLKLEPEQSESWIYRNSK